MGKNKGGVFHLLRLMNIGEAYSNWNLQGVLWRLLGIIIIYLYIHEALIECINDKTHEEICQTLDKSFPDDIPTDDLAGFHSWMAANDSDEPVVG